MKQIYAVFRDVEDVVNHRPMRRRYLSPAYRETDALSKNQAVDWMATVIQRDGFTLKELIKIKEIEFPMPQ